MKLIKKISARKIIDSRSKFTVEAKINGITGASPSGTSKGKYEAKEIDVDESLKLINEDISRHFIGKEFAQESFDKKLIKIDGTENFSKIGGNTSTALSFAFFNLGFQNVENVFPYQLANVFGGGKHGGFSDIQEFLVIPFTEKTVQECHEANRKFYNEFKSLLEKKTGKTGTNMEGAITGKIRDEKVLDIMSNLSEELPVKLGIDMASSEIWNGKEYVYKNFGKNLDSGDQVDFVRDLSEKYKLYYVEDAFHEDDFEGFYELNKKIGNRSLVCGDDITVTNTKRIRNALDKKSINSIIIKPNQIGTVTQAKIAVDLSFKNNLTTILSHRSGETKDTTISRIAVNWRIPIIKIGFNREDTEKMNELKRLWEKSENPKMASL